MTRTSLMLATLGTFLAFTGLAAARITPAWSYVPAKVRAQLAAQSGGVLYLPARTPLFYRYRSGAKVVNGKLSVPFTNRVRIRQGLWRWTKQSFLWQVLPLPASATCTTWAKPEKTYQYAGNKVYFANDASGGKTWRCVTDRRGRRLVLVASHAPQFAGRPILQPVASGLDVARR
jgi:ribosomal protein L35AE/L33A